MKNLTKYFLLLIISLLILLSFSFSVEKAAAQTGCKQDYTSCVTAYNSCNQSCLGKNQNNYSSYDDYTKDYYACVNKCANNDNTCNRNVDNAYSQCLLLSPTSIPAPTSAPAPKLTWQKIASCLAPTPTQPAPATSTPAPTSPPQAPCYPDGTFCNRQDRITNCTNGVITFSNCPAGQACIVGAAEPECKPTPPTSTKTPTPTAIPTATFTTSCPTNSDAQCGAGTPPFPNCTGLLYSAGTPISNCTKELPNCWSCPLPTPTPTPVSQCLPTDCGLCAVGSSCQQVANVSTKSCACQSSTPTSAPTPTTTPVPTPLPGSVQLTLALTQQGLTGTPVNRNRSVTVVLQGADDQIVAKTGTADFSNGTFNGTVNLGVLPSGSYKLKVKVGNFLKSPIRNLVISGTAASAQTTLVAGLADQFNDNVDAISFYANGLRTCFGSTLGVEKCGNPEDVDLNGDGNVDVIDYQIYLKGIRSLVQGLPVL